MFRRTIENGVNGSKDGRPAFILEDDHDRGGRQVRRIIDRFAQRIARVGNRAPERNLVAGANVEEFLFHHGVDVFRFVGRQLNALPVLAGTTDARRRNRVSLSVHSFVRSNDSNIFRFRFRPVVAVEDEGDDEQDEQTQEQLRSTPVEKPVEMRTQHLKEQLTSLSVLFESFSFSFLL